MNISNQDIQKLKDALDNANLPSHDRSVLYKGIVYNLERDGVALHKAWARDLNKNA